MYQLDGKTLSYGIPFTTSDGTQYPGDWLAVSTEEQRTAIGIVVVEDPTPINYDRRFYYGIDNPKDLTALKTEWVARQKNYVNSFLKETDWYAARAHDTGIPVPEAVFTYRNSVRTVCALREADIEACVDVPELQALVTAPEQNTIVVVEYQEATYDENGVELTPEVQPVYEYEQNPDALTIWPEMGVIVESPAIDYRTFYGALQLSAVYATIRTQAATTLAVNVYCTEFIAAIGEAKAGLPQPLVIQQTINDLIGSVTLTTTERTELETLMTAYGLSLVYTLPAV